MSLVCLSLPRIQKSQINLFFFFKKLPRFLGWEMDWSPGFRLHSYTVRAGAGRWFQWMPGWALERGRVFHAWHSFISSGHFTKLSVSELNASQLLFSYLYWDTNFLLLFMYNILIADLTSYTIFSHLPVYFGYLLLCNRPPCNLEP